jgi:hypothetical protein
METGVKIGRPVTGNSAEIMSDEFVKNAMIAFLKANGFKTTTGNSKKGNHLIATSLFKKEIIEIKGGPSNFFLDTDGLGLQKHLNPAQQAIHWFTDALFNSFLNFGKYFQNENVVIAMALPDVSRYKAIIEKLQDYFTFNDLFFKVYLVDENGGVTVSNLNAKYH